MNSLIKQVEMSLYDPNKKYLFRDKIKTSNENADYGIMAVGIVGCFYGRPDGHPSGKEAIVNFFNLRGESIVERRTIDNIVLTEIPEDEYARILAAHEEK